MNFKSLWNNYPSFDLQHVDPKTGKDIFSNHCAINVSHALSESGVKINGPTKCWNCSYNGVHAIRARELASWLNKNKRNFNT